MNRVEMFKHIKKYSDKFFLTHLHPNPTVNGSENSPMFSALVWLLFEKIYGLKFKEKTVIKMIVDRYETEKGYQTYTGEQGRAGNFSHDNMTGATTLHKLVDEKPQLWPYNFKQHSHPRDIAFYLYAKLPFIFWFLIPIASLAMGVSCYQNYKYRGGRQILKTDGKLLTFLRCEGHGLKFTFLLCSWFIYRNPKFGSWENISKIYFKDKEHPINLMMPIWEEEFLKGDDLMKSHFRKLYNQNK